MLPTGSTLTPNEALEFKQQSSQTYKIDFEQKRIIGSLNGLEAVKQSIKKILCTSRFEHLIYSDRYGSDIKTLIGKAPALVQSELKRRISEALMQDDRIKDVGNFRFDSSGDSGTVSFVVTSVFGSFSQEQEVKEIV
ncbi:DUF2634 domain-containing protein [Paenibacillus larvae]|uniref:Phage protein n=2 Tax=Paenibacillus larvae subsp. larvae TaxID=147375 RepID=V9W8W8_9BACL|nr:DUF2634 domain-containing protein [Paenibacillus larvae]AHD06145.1 phage protein [Paenibacillus larvae subsp. larvae DSM 25430]AVG12679.1 phage protein [Paenibacillus larvae subsp. larvae DSM 25430]MDR5569313.1 DUF2634 domain-containing protein [Paenibacillus larvae]MDR5596402.1 DUF2634 domain-containing protein [Paenibacillus larvae]QHZ51329.1 phage protein [Paenibacillus larvae subsp. larvae]